ncbi:MAG: T9SS type A sorting domain-containing protein [Flavobacteriales bacterium]
MKTLSLLLFCAFSMVGFAQTWSGEVAQIFYNKCTSCHHNGGIAPFSLMTYQESSPMAASIYGAISPGAPHQMPPWPPDNSYQQYLHDRSLSTSEKSTLLNWLNGGALEGDPSQTPPPPVYNTGSILGSGDVSIKMPNYVSNATSSLDDYVCFAVPTNLTQTRTIKAVEVIPGNMEIVHHALIYIDHNGVETSNTTGFCSSPSSASTKLLTAYVPGSSPLVFPSVSPLKLGVDIGPGSKIYFAMHYPNGSAGMLDSTKVILHFYPPGTSGVRQVSADPVVADYSFNLPPNQLTTLTAQYPQNGGVPVAISALSVAPHMHLLGKSIKSYALSANNLDTLKHINVPNWDFHWQGFYTFTTLQKIPAGYKVKGEAVYDNTSNNPNNPNVPPVNVTFGENTTDEMFIVYYHYLLYQPGDENYNLSELVSASLSEYPGINPVGVKIYPNPLNDGNLTLEFNEPLTSGVKIYIYNNQGKMVNDLSAQCVNNVSKINWNGETSESFPCPPGLYHVSVNHNGRFYSVKIIKQ